MKKITLLALMAVVLYACCPKSEQTKQNTAAGVIGKPSPDSIKSDKLTPEVLWMFGRVGEVALSPDKKTIVFGVKYYDLALNKGNTDLYVMDTDGNNLKQITQTAGSEFNLCWRPDGKKIAFLFVDEGATQIFEMNADGTERTKVSNIEGGLNGFKYSPDGKNIVYFQEVDLVNQVVDIYPDLPKANALIYDDLMARHWDTWTATYSHLFISQFDGKMFQTGTDIMKDEKFDCPNKPNGGAEQFNWSPDSKNIVYSCVKKTGKDYALSTNADIYIYNLDNKQTTNVSEGMMGYDVAPVYSPDGKKIAWESMERDGYEADKIRLMIYDIAANTKTDFTKGFDQNAQGLEWSTDGNTIFFNSDFQARHQIYKLDLQANKISAVTSGDHNYLQAWDAGDKLIGTKQSISLPTEIFAINKADGKETQISFVNKDILAKIKMGEVKERWVKTTDGKQMLVWVIYPPNFDPNKKYPALLYCQGGPQSSVSQFFSYRWNFQIMAANDYIVVAPNRRGLPSFGQAWNEQISGDYGGQNMKDYLAAIDDVAKEPYVKKDGLGCVGASYGGFSAFWLAGHHEKRFKAFVAHCGMFNLQSQYLETEEMWFVNFDLGGPYWDKNNKIAQNSYANSPHLFVDKWDTPILVVHGEKDFRISFTQGLQAFAAARLRNIEARFLLFPEENHWVLSPQNGVLWQRVYFDWLDKHLKK